MENEYNYYKPENNSNDQGGYSYNGSSENGNAKKPKKNGNGKKWATVVSMALVFGLVGGTTFQGTNYLVGKMMKSDEKIESIQPSSTVETARLNKTTSTVTSDVSGIVEETLPSIVSITNMSVQQVQNFFGGVMEYPSQSAGTGVIVSQNDKELLIVTNNHVVEGSDTLTVTFSDEQSVEANIKGTDAAHDLAVISVPTEKIPEETKNTIKIAAVGDSDSLKVGEPAIAIGNALGYGQSVTTGIISATKRSLDDYDGTYIQTDAAINPGNSGGALLNANGEVIGINSAKISDSSVEGIGFAIPITDASNIIENLMNKETREKVAEADRGVIGIKGYDVNAESAKMYNMPVGVYVAEVVNGGGAEQAGITKGSIITEFEGSTVDSMSTLQGLLEYYKAGETVTMTVKTPGQNGEYTENQVSVTLSKNS